MIITASAINNNIRRWVIEVEFIANAIMVRYIKIYASPDI